MRTLGMKYWHLFVFSEKNTIFHAEHSWKHCIKMKSKEWFWFHPSWMHFGKDCVLKLCACFKEFKEKFFSNKQSRIHNKKQYFEIWWYSTIERNWKNYYSLSSENRKNRKHLKPLIHFSSAGRRNPSCLLKS